MTDVILPESTFNKGDFEITLRISADKCLNMHVFNIISYESSELCLDSYNYDKYEKVGIDIIKLIHYALTTANYDISLYEFHINTAHFTKIFDLVRIITRYTEISVAKIKKTHADEIKALRDDIDLLRADMHKLITNAEHVSYKNYTTINCIDISKKTKNIMFYYNNDDRDDDSDDDFEYVSMEKLHNIYGEIYGEIVHKYDKFSPCHIAGIRDNSIPIIISVRVIFPHMLKELLLLNIITIIDSSIFNFEEFKGFSCTELHLYNVSIDNSLDLICDTLKTMKKLTKLTIYNVDEFTGTVNFSFTDHMPLLNTLRKSKDIIIDNDIREDIEIILL